MGRLYLAGRNEEAAAIRRASEGPSRVLEGRLYHWNGQEWRIIAKPRSGKYYAEPATLSDIFIESVDKVWAVGGNGVILFGNAEHGFQDVSFKGNDETDREKNFKDGVRWRSDLVLATGTELFRFDGHLAKPFESVRHG
ncbi:hypothetical protein IE4803_PC00417 (plasmid) [Rhizobium etli bv. phaseoli str. IE4803]|nr:hypothetical protein IE4803_PC00417 [Rhizobium etli bv. phaseoli str. IE4803]